MKDLRKDITGLFLDFFLNYFNQFSVYMRFYHRIQHICKFTPHSVGEMILNNFIRREFNYTLLILKESIKC